MELSADADTLDTRLEAALLAGRMPTATMEARVCRTLSGITKVDGLWAKLVQEGVLP